MCRRRLCVPFGPFSAVLAAGSGITAAAIVAAIIAAASSAATAACNTAVSAAAAAASSAGSAAAPGQVGHQSALAALLPVRSIVSIHNRTPSIQVVDVAVPHTIL